MKTMIKRVLFMLSAALALSGCTRLVTIDPVEQTAYRAQAPVRVQLDKFGTKAPSECGWDSTYVFDEDWTKFRDALIKVSSGTFDVNPELGTPTGSASDTIIEIQPCFSYKYKVKNHVYKYYFSIRYPGGQVEKSDYEFVIEQPNVAESFLDLFALPVALVGGADAWTKGRENAAITLFNSIVDSREFAKLSRPANTAGPPLLSASVAFAEPSGNKMLDGEEEGTLSITVRNTGAGDAFDVEARLKPAKEIKGLNYADSVDLGSIPSGKTVTKDITIKAGDDTPSGSAAFEIETLEANGFDADPIKIAFQTRAFQPPRVIVADMAIDDQNRNSQVEPMETVSMTVRLQNVGQGSALDVAAEVLSGKNVFIGGDFKTRFDLGTLLPGEHRDITFMFYTNRRITNGQKIPIDIAITEERARFNSQTPLDLVMNAKQKSVQEIVVKGIDAPKGDVTIAAGLGIDVEQNLPSTNTSSRDAVAVVIGNRDYQKTKRVEFALNDAAAVKMYLTEVLGYRPGNILYASNATKGEFELIFGNKDNPEGKLFDLVKPGRSDVFIYYSGHGAPGLRDKKGYFVPIEADPNYVELGGYSTDVFYDNLSKLPAQSITVVLDACFSGAELLENISPMVVEIESPTLKMNNAVVISSSRGSEVSSWYEEKKHGMFTYFFLKAIHDRNADFNKDDKLTFDEVYRFVSDKSDGVPYYARREHSVIQTPTIEGQYKNKVLVQYK